MKQYVVTREDLAPCHQAVQAGHALKKFTKHFPKYNDVENLVYLSVPDEDALVELEEKLYDAGVGFVEFEEPDFGDALTAIAIAPDGERLLAALPLALRPPRLLNPAAVSVCSPGG